ncbi:hypothetical protein KAS79_00495 [Candidatus Parcubacteria bacterium]|nr:hypothetical protein [Candidatus Parcubacteria bacterium]
METIDKQNLMTGAGKNLENKIIRSFKKHNLQCIKLDKVKSGKRPDCYVYTNNDSKQGFICEIKSIISGGSIENGKYLLSTKDPEFRKSIRLNPKLRDHDKVENVLKRKLKDVLNYAIQQYNSLIVDESKYKQHPFVVVICEDFFAEILHSCNFGEIFKNGKEISAIIKLVKNYEKEQINKRHLKELNDYYHYHWKDRNYEKPGKKWNEDYGGIPDTVRFKIWLNDNARIKFKANKFFRNPIIIHS